MKQLLILTLSLLVPRLMQAASLPYQSAADHTRVQAGCLPNSIYSELEWTNEGLNNPGKKDLRLKSTPGFFKRIAILQQVMKEMRHQKLQDAEINPADKKAKDSLWVGIIALVCAMIPWYTIFVAIPLGVLAIGMGNQAKRMGSAHINGKGFGIAALALVAVWMLLVAAFVIGFASSWGIIFGGQ